MQNDDDVNHVVGRVLPERKDLPLSKLAISINSQYNRAMRKMQGAALDFVEIGVKLQDAKAKLKHGEFGPWLQQNCPQITWRHATRLMHVAESYGDLTTARKQEILKCTNFHQVMEFLAGNPPKQLRPVNPLEREQKKLRAKREDQMCPHVGCDRDGISAVLPCGQHRLDFVLDEIYEMTDQELEVIQINLTRLKTARLKSVEEEGRTK